MLFKQFRCSCGSAIAAPGSHGPEGVRPHPAARVSGTPAYFYSGERVLAKLRLLRAALASTGLPFAVKYAMKANRFGPLLTWLKASGLKRPGLQSSETVTIAGNINEALDVWAEGVRLPPFEEGDLLVLLNAAAMSSDHCMRAQATEHLLLPAD